MADTIVKLSRRYEVPGQEPFDSITLREPTYRDIFMSGLGVPCETHMSRTGVVMITHYSVVDEYLERLTQSPAYSALAVLDSHDALEVCDTVCGFFTKVREATKE